MKWFALVSFAAMLTFAANPEILRVDSVNDSQIVHREMPGYPSPDIHVKGVVKVRITIGTNGQVEQVRLISGHPLLAPAAMHAARQWVFKPFETNGHAVRAVTELDFPFAPPN